MSNGMENASEALIGHTGFVGGTLARAHSFRTCVNSSNVDTLRGRHFDLIVCAGVSAVKWLANKEPMADRAGIARLTDALAETTADEFILISTIDVYPDPVSGADESAAINAIQHQPYGRHRLELEEWVRARFPQTRIVRLPALFGPGLRKNALYDLLHGNMMHAINPASVFQWYPTERLWTDIGTVRAHALSLVNLFPEPLAMSAIIKRFFPGAPVGREIHPGVHYDLHTRHGALFDGAGTPYVMDAQAVTQAMARFVGAERGHAT